MNTDRDETETVGVSTTRKTFELLEALKAEEGVTIAALTQRTDLPKSTVYRHLQTLTDMGYVIERDGKYYVGFRFVELGEQARSRKVGYTAAKRAVFELGQETDERAVFIVEEDDEAVYVHRYGSLSNTMIGHRRPLHSMASGKIILAVGRRRQSTATSRRWDSRRSRRTRSPIPTRCSTNSSGSVTGSTR